MFENENKIKEYLSQGSWKDIYLKDKYLETHSKGGEQEAPWKANKIFKIITEKRINPKTICDVGCGSGEILKQLQLRMAQDCIFTGYEISPLTFELCKNKINDRLSFQISDITQQNNAYFDLILLIDVIEHIEDYFEFLRNLKSKSQFKILHIPLDLCLRKFFYKNAMLEYRKRSGHIHYFSKDIALQILAESGYEILDSFYTQRFYEEKAISTMKSIAQPIWKLLFTMNSDLTVRFLGGCSLMVLAT